MPYLSFLGKMFIGNVLELLYMVHFSFTLKFSLDSKSNWTTQRLFKKYLIMELNEQN